MSHEKYLLECVRYIHQNPSKANISSIDKYKWSSHREYINIDKNKAGIKIFLERTEEDIFQGT